MVKLTDLQFAALLEEIGCAMRNDTPIDAAMKRLQTRRLGRVGRAAETISQGLERGEGLADAVSAIHSAGGAQAAAAIRAGERSGDPSLLERISVQLRRRADFDSETRLAWFYPVALLAIGYVGGALVMAPMIRKLEGDDFHWTPWVVATARWLETNWWIPPVVVGAALLVLLSWLLLRSRFPRVVRKALFCEALADQLTHDVPDDLAIVAAAEMAGDQEMAAIANPSLESPEITNVLSACKIRPSESVGMSSKETIIAQLRYLGSLYLEQARQRSYFWSRLVPRCCMVMVGAGLTLSYVWWVIAPVYREVAQW